MKKYMTRMGQKTGTLKKSKNVVKIAMRVDITVCSLRKCKCGSYKHTDTLNSTDVSCALSLYFLSVYTHPQAPTQSNHTTVVTSSYQNLNSGNRRMKGLNSSLLLVGRDGPSSSSEGRKLEEGEYSVQVGYR